jgi:hypothetical protein
MEKRKLSIKVLEIIFVIIVFPVLLSGCKKEYTLVQYTDWEYVDISEYNPYEYKYVLGYLNNNKIPVYDFAIQDDIFKDLNKYKNDNLIQLEYVNDNIINPFNY